MDVELSMWSILWTLLKLLNGIHALRAFGLPEILTVAQTEALGTGGGPSGYGVNHSQGPSISISTVTSISVHIYLNLHILYIF